MNHEDAKDAKEEKEENADDLAIERDCWRMSEGWNPSDIRQAK